MKHLKKLYLAIIAASALMAFVGTGTASATTLTGTGCVGSESSCAVGTTIKAESEGHAVLDSLAGKIECNVTVHGETTTPGGGTPTGSVDVSVTTLAFTGCTTATVHVKAGGSLTIISAGGNKGTVVSHGLSVTVVTFGLHCGFTTAGETIGTLTGGTSAKLALTGSITRTYGTSGGFCGMTAPWTGSLKVTAPSTLNID